MGQVVQKWTTRREGNRERERENTGDEQPVSLIQDGANTPGKRQLMLGVVMEESSF